ncbi:uncharacterized GPI-anchored protein At1g61900-like [Coffea eugenioides]|uniref:uncharacterized GPI-anchored protein At1g61900-like n=1 Tax=Coffea eugenioides TaxID=49369 RepID=UPI000F60816B|nr:uncharacterized GPI-anchored protein At1g61900-like [Coffea eugenioides]
MESYMSHLQEQSFVTNLQAVNCASLQCVKISSNVYSLYYIKLKDFSPQGSILPKIPTAASAQIGLWISKLMLALLATSNIL